FGTDDRRAAIGEQNRPHRPPPLRQQWDAGHVIAVVRRGDERRVHACLSEARPDLRLPSLDLGLREDRHPASLAVVPAPAGGGGVLPHPGMIAELVSIL